MTRCLSMAQVLRNSTSLLRILAREISFFKKKTLAKQIKKMLLN
jgi:hypothetical protein